MDSPNRKLNGLSSANHISINNSLIGLLTHRTKDNETLVNSERLEIIETSDTYSLKINKAVMTDAGNYSVKLTNALGEETKSAAVTVKCKLIFLPHFHFFSFIFNRIDLQLWLNCEFPRSCKD